jgi:HAE1 family hydrophobic/amphiphilic exporter-1
VVLAVVVFATSIAMVPLLGTEFVPKSDFSETTLNFYTPMGSSLEVTEAKARQVEAIVRAQPEVRYTLTTINTGNAPGKISPASMCAWSTARTASAAWMRCPSALRARLQKVPGITVTHVGLLDSVGGNKQIQFSIQGPNQGELERMARLGDGTAARHPRAGRPGLQRQARQADAGRGRAPRRGLRPRRQHGADRHGAAHPGGRPDRGQLARARRPDLRRQRAAGARGAQRAAQDLERLPFSAGTNADGSRGSCG